MDKFLGDSVNPGRVIKEALFNQLVEKDDLAAKQREVDRRYQQMEID